eukprot:8977040-Pyramimonas_sp.AAC.1
MWPNCWSRECGDGLFPHARPSCNWSTSGLYTLSLRAIGPPQVNDAKGGVCGLIGQELRGRVHNHPANIWGEN